MDYVGICTRGSLCAKFDNGELLGKSLQVQLAVDHLPASPVPETTRDA